jgi:hypothetical protein
MVRQNGVLTYLHADALGRAALATTVTGTLVSQRRYLPYGATRWSSGPLLTAGSLSISQSLLAVL